MKAVTAPPPPYNGEWLYEVKFDGFRVLAIKNGKNVELWSRNQKPLNERFPEVVRAVAKLPVKRCVLDGEVCALDAQGRSSFQLLQNSGETAHPVVYYVFDVLFEGSTDLRGLSLLERKNKAGSHPAAGGRSDPALRLFHGRAGAGAAENEDGGGGGIDREAEKFRL